MMPLLLDPAAHTVAAPGLAVHLLVLQQPSRMLPASDLRLPGAAGAWSGGGWEQVGEEVADAAVDVVADWADGFEGVRVRPMVTAGLANAVEAVNQ